jgi:hypothetical protein
MTVDLFPITHDDLRGEVDRITKERRRVYPALIRKGKLDPDLAERRILMLERIANLLMDMDR